MNKNADDELHQISIIHKYYNEQSNHKNSFEQNKHKTLFSD